MLKNPHGLEGLIRDFHVQVAGSITDNGYIYEIPLTKMPVIPSPDIPLHTLLINIVTAINNNLLPIPGLAIFHGIEMVHVNTY